MPKGVSATYAGAARSAAARKGAATRAAARAAQAIARLAIPPEELARIRGTEAHRAMHGPELRDIVDRAIAQAKAALAARDGGSA